MKNLIVKGIIIISGVFLVDIIIGFLGTSLIKRYSSYPCDEETTILSYCLNAADQDIVIIGASSARNAIIPTVLEANINNKTEKRYSVFNASANGATMAYKYATAMSICDRNKTKIILLDIWMHDLHKQDQTGLGVIRPFCHSNKYAAKCLYDNSSIIDKILLQSNIYCWKATFVKYVMQLRNFNVSDGYYPKIGYFIEDEERKNESDSNEAVDSIANNELETLLTYAKKKGIKVIAINFPRYYQMNENSVENIEIKRIFQENGFPYIDLWSNDVFNDNALFYDERHLNDNGARICTRIIADEIAKYI